MSSFQMEDISCPTFEGTSDYGSRDNSGSEEQTISGFTTIYSNLEGRNFIYLSASGVSIDLLIRQ